ncbi:MAG TPA: CBS domain-containing protein [Gemmatimonadales bacterium]|nr:CBS domain-containing protein [Gemmatimonadales bacterium]
MRLADLLSRRRVVVPLEADTWDKGIRALLDACLADGKIRDQTKMETAVRNAWPEDTLSLGPHAVLPHFRTDAVDDVVAALGVARKPMTGRGAEPEDAAAGARIMLLILAPPREAAAYLQAVAAFARALAQPDVVNGLHAARTSDDVLALPGLEGVRLEDELLVGDVMSPVGVALAPEQPIEAAARLLARRGLDAAPVVGSDGVVIGLLSSRELLRYFLPSYVQRVQTGEHKGMTKARASAATAMPGQVGSVMARNVLCVSEDQSLSDVATLLANKEVSCLPVVRDGVLRGVLTRAEIVRKLVGQEERGS